MRHFQRGMEILAAIAILYFTARAHGENPPSGDAVIRGTAGPSDVVLITTSRLAGAVHSLLWGGNTFTVTHGYGGSTAQEWLANRVVAMHAYYLTFRGYRRLPFAALNLP